MRTVFLGTNGWYDTSTGNTSCILIESEEYSIVLDAGNGLHKLDKYCIEDKPVFLFLSHFHLDHIIGLHILGKFSFSKGLVISGPKGTKGILETIVNPPFTLPLSELPFKVKVRELPEEGMKLPIHVECVELLHSSLTLGYRIHLEGKVVVYCPDTGYCENAVKLAMRADLLIAECSFRSGECCSEWPHLNPHYAARIAREAEAQRLVLTHFDASRYTSIESRRTAEDEAKIVFPDSIAARDDMEIEV